MNLEEEYLNYLIHQFMSANGVNSKKNLNGLANELKDWLQLEKINGRVYTSFLTELNIPFDTPCCAEIGKGEADSVVLNRKSTTIITPYLEKIREDSNNLILPFAVSVINGNLQLKNNKNIISGFDSYMTQNPYTETHLQGWETLHLKKIPITIGVYGKITDKDREQKLKLIRNMKDKLDSNIIVLENETYQDTYVSIIATKEEKNEIVYKKVKKLKR